MSSINDLIPAPARYGLELDTLASIADILATRTDYNLALRAILELFESKLNLVRGTIMLLSPDNGELIVVAVQHGDAPVADAARYRWGEGVTGKVVQTGTPAIIRRIASEPLFRNRIHHRRGSQADDTAFICVPIMIEQEVVGTLAADVPEAIIADLQSHARFLRIVGGMIANDVRAQREAMRARATLVAENLELRTALGQSFRPENMVGTSTAMQALYLKLSQVRFSSTTVLIRGESGTGKELVAAAIHFGSSRNQRAFVRVNCAALNDNLLESELFGHERGAFTGALSTRIGRIEEADGGTLMLDEIGDISITMQVKLLRVLQEREFERVGSNRTQKVDVRILAATNRDLEAAVRQGTFRQDLYYRINVFPLFLPPLRERREDIVSLANHFVEKFSRAANKQVPAISNQTIQKLMGYPWPGNVRELENCIEHAVLVAQGNTIHPSDLPPTHQDPVTVRGAPGTLDAQVQNLESDLIRDALLRSEGNMTTAAHMLGITPRMIRYKIKNLGIAAS